MSHNPNFIFPSGVTLRHELLPGDIGHIVARHGLVYAREYGWDHTFEAYVAQYLGEFAVKASPRSRIWMVEEHGKMLGTIAIAEFSEAEAQLRWLFLEPEARGRGLGKALIASAIEFCRMQRYTSVFLWTVSELTTAGALYRTFGFRKNVEQHSSLWGARVTEERYDLELASMG